MISNMTLQGLDKLDRKILSSLLSNGRESIANLSRNIGLSRTAVAERINRLEKTGIIKGYTAQIRVENEGRKAASYLLISCEKGKKNEVTNALKEIPEVRLTSVVGVASTLLLSLKHLTCSLFTTYVMKLNLLAEFRNSTQLLCYTNQLVDKFLGSRRTFFSD